MGKLIAINGSPRPAVSNSKKYIALFERYYPGDIQVFNALSRDYTRHLEALRNADEILLVFPLYADALPVSLMGFLKAMDAARLAPLKVHIKKRIPVWFNSVLRLRRGHFGISVRIYGEMENPKVGKEHCQGPSTDA